MSPTESKGSGSTSPSSKPQTPEEPKRPDSLLGRFERREHLKKANTLPSSVTGKNLHSEDLGLKIIKPIIAEMIPSFSDFNNLHLLSKNEWMSCFSLYSCNLKTALSGLLVRQNLNLKTPSGFWEIMMGICHFFLTL